MTVSTELSHEEYTGNGVTTDFDFRFRIFEAKHLVVSVADTDGTERIMKNGTDYTLRGVGSHRGGKVILKMPLAQGWKIGIARDLPATQETDLRNQGKFFAEVHEDALDYLTMLIQKSLGFLSLCLRKPSFISDHFDAKGNKISNLGKPVKDGDAVNLGTMNDRIGAIDRRSLRVADKDILALPGAAVRANKLLSFDKGGNPLVVVPESGSAADVLSELASDEQGKGDALIAAKQPVAGAATRTQHDRNFDTLSLRDFGAFCDGVNDDSPAICKLMDYLASLPHVKYRGTGPNAGGIKIITSGQISVSEPIIFKNTRNLCLDGWYVKPLPGFPRGEFLLQFPSGGQIEVTANENVSLRDVTLDCGWEASGLLLQDFTNVRSDGLYVYKFHSYGVKTENVLNSSHEFVCSNLQIGQMSWGESYPEHVTMGVGVSNGNADNIYSNIVVGYCKTKSFEVTGDEGGVKSGGGSLFINQMHVYSGYVPMTIDSSHVYISNSYFDGDYISCKGRGISIIGSFFQFTGSEPNRLFIDFKSDYVGECYIVGNKFTNRDNASNIKMTSNIEQKDVYSSFIHDNSSSNVVLTRVYPRALQEKTFPPSKWVDTDDGIYLDLDFPSYKGTKSVTVESMDIDRTKLFSVVRTTGNTVRIYCWYANGAGKAKPQSNVIVYSSNQIPPDANGTA
ncbi:hypothetical protein [Morganella morganii]|uniref:hypothetical protein n=1 Tax=Morganella morganii TaxID=582 RepID=UPI00068D2D33|nr:hypothetical protein [Morganella morganii]